MDKKNMRESLQRIRDDINKKDGQINTIADRKSRRPEYFIAIGTNIIMFYIFNNIFEWHIAFIKPSFKQVLFYINVTIILTIVSHMLFFIYEERWFQQLLRLCIAISGIMVMYMLLKLFPFNLSALLGYPASEIIMKVILYIGMIGTGIASIVEFVRLVSALKQLNKRV